MKIALLALTSVLATLGVAEGQILVTDENISIYPDIVMGSIGNTVAVYRFTNQSNENAALTSLRIFDSTLSTQPTFANVQLVSGATTLGGRGNLAGTPTDGSQGYAWTMEFVPHVIIPAEGSLLLAIKADVQSYTAGEVQDNSIHRFQITAASSVNAVGVSSNQPFTVLAFAYGVPMRVLRSGLTVSTVEGSPTSSTITFVAGSGGNDILHKLTITFRDERGTPTFLSPDNIYLLIPGIGDVVAGGSALKIASGNTITWFFNPGFGIFAGGEVSFQLQMPVPLAASIAQATDLVFADGDSPDAITGLNLSTQNFPIKISGAPHVR